MQFFCCNFQVLRDYVLHTKTVPSLCARIELCKILLYIYGVVFFMQDLNDSQCLFVCLFVFFPANEIAPGLGLLYWS